MGSIQGFDEAIDRKPADEVIKLLNQLYTVCDNVIAETDVIKIKTFRDKYLVICINTNFRRKPVSTRFLLPSSWPVEFQYAMVLVMLKSWLLWP